MADWLRIGARAAEIITRQRGLLQTFSWHGQTYQGARTQLRRQEVAATAGLQEDYSFSLLCPVAQFGGLEPEPRRDTVRIGGAQYRILALNYDAARATIRLDLGAFNA